MLDSHSQIGQLFIPYWIMTLALQGELTRTVTKKFENIYIILLKIEIFIFENVYLFTVFYFFSFIIKKNFHIMDELSTLSISLSIASLGIFFLFFTTNDDDDQDGGKLIKSAQRIN